MDMENKQELAKSNEVATRKAGKASTIKSFKTLVVNLKDSGLVSKTDWEVIKGLYQKTVKQYMGEELL